MNDTTFGQLIKENRQKLGISNRKLADKLGLSSGYVFQIEKGNYQPPSEAVLKKMAEIFNMHSDTLIAKAGKVPSDIIAGLLEFPEAIPHLRNNFKNERAKKQAQNTNIPLNSEAGL